MTELLSYRVFRKIIEENVVFSISTEKCVLVIENLETYV